MLIEIHPNAAKNFNDKSVELVAELIEINGELHWQGEAGGFIPDVHVQEVEPLTFDVGTPIILDSTGNPIGMRLFDHQNKPIGLSLENSQKLDSLARSIYKTKGLSDIVSLGFVRKTARDWLGTQYPERALLTFTDYFLVCCQESLKEMEFWLPIAQTYIEEDLHFGRVIFKTISKDMFDKWDNKVANMSSHPGANREGAQKLLARQRQELQGLAAATIKLVIEPSRGEEIALEEAEKAISFLRIFSPANVNPKITSYSHLLGRENIQSFNYIRFYKDSDFSFCSGLVEPDEIQHWYIDKKLLITMEENGLEIIENLVNLKKRTQFQETVVNALTLYCRSSLMKDLSDRLVYILVPLESVLLADDNEPIMQNISERLALLIGESIEERLEIKSNIKAVYGLRSKFIHHGKTIDPEEIEALRYFMFNAWRFFLFLAQNAGRFHDKAEAIRTIEEMKFSGGIV